MDSDDRRWKRDYKLALATGTDSLGRDLFDLLFLRIEDVPIVLVFDANFPNDGDAASASRAFEEAGYDVHLGQHV